MITLYKGDDTGGQLGKNVKIVFHCDDAVDMDDVVVKFDLLGIVKREFTDVHDGDILDIFISHAESRKFPLGVIFAKMWGEDASGKLRTFANRIPFRVTLNLIAVYGSDGTDSQDIHVYSSVDWDSIANKPTVFPSSVEEVEGLQEALDAINEKIPEDASADNKLADKDWVDQEIDRVAAYYITSNAQGDPFPTQASLLNAETYYSGGSPRTPTRNDYAIVLADESHDNAEWRYIYSVNEQGVGTWEAQYPVEGAIVADDNVTRTSTNPVKSSGIWAALWGALAALPAGFSSMYDWCVAQLAGKASTADATLMEKWTQDFALTDAQKEEFSSTPGASDNDYALTIVPQTSGESYILYVGSYDAAALRKDPGNITNLIFEGGDARLGLQPGDIVATLSGYTLGSQTDKPLASEAEAEALRSGKQNALTAQQLANIAAVSDALAFDATRSYAAGDPVVYNGTLYTFTAAHTGAWTGSDVSAVNIIAILAGKANDTDVVHKSGDETIAGNKTFTGDVEITGDNLELHNDAYPEYSFSLGTDSSGRLYFVYRTAAVVPGITLAYKSEVDAKADASAIPYTLTTKTISNGAVTLDDRAANAVTISSTLDPNTLTINFPTATSGKVRDFALRLNIAAGVTAPEIAWPQGVTLENDGGEVPEIADGGTGGSSTILYFSETENNGTTAKFLVKGETLTAITQA